MQIVKAGGRFWACRCLDAGSLQVQIFGLVPNKCVADCRTGLTRGWAMSISRPLLP